MSGMWKPRKPVDQVKAAYRFDEETRMAIQYPRLTGFLCSLENEDGSSRETGTLTVFLQDGVLKGCLKDREVGLVTFHSSTTWEDLLAGLDELLGDADAEWRADRTGKRR